MWITFVPLILVSILVLTGLILLTKGLIGRRIEHAPKCRKCRYDLTGLVSERCPECGSVVAEVGTINWHRQRHPGLILTGLLCLLPLIGAGVMAGKRIEYYIDGYNYKPTGWVIDDAASDNYRLSQHAYRELCRRLRQGTVSTKHISRLKEMILNDWATKSLASGLSPLTDAFGELSSAGHFTGLELATIFDRAITISMKTRPTSLLEYGVPVEVEFASRGLPTRFSAADPLIRIVDADDQTPLSVAPGQRVREINEYDHYFPIGRHPLMAETLREQVHELRAPGHLNSKGRIALFFLHTEETGTYEWTFALRVDVMSGRGPTRTLVHTLETRVTLSTSVVEQPPPGDIELIHDPKLKEPLRNSITFQTRPAEDASSASSESKVSVEVRITNCPATIAAEGVFLNNGQEVERRPVVVRAHGGSSSITSTRRIRSNFSVPMADLKAIDFLLVPKPELAYRYATADITRIWGEEIRFENVSLVASPSPRRGQHAH